MNYKLWDKVSPINGVAAETVLKSDPSLQYDDIILFYEQEDVIQLMEHARMLQSIYKLSNAGVDAVATAHINAIMADKQMAQQAADAIESRLTGIENTMDLILLKQEGIL